MASSDLPIGTVLPVILNPGSLPKNWLPCDGSTIPAQYQELTTLLGSQTTPNLIGRVLIGAGDMSRAAMKQTDGLDPHFGALGTGLSVGNTGGECQHTLSTDEMPSHAHSINKSNFGLHGRSFKGEDDNDIPFETNPSIPLGGTDPAGGGKGHYNVQPYYAINYMIFGGNV